jgi:hypothetical protein
MIVGIVTGTYSSVFIASAIAIIWQSRVAGSATMAQTAPEPTTATRARKPARRRAS